MRLDWLLRKHNKKPKISKARIEREPEKSGQGHAFVSRIKLVADAREKNRQLGKSEFMMLKRALSKQGKKFSSEKELYEFLKTDSNYADPNSLVRIEIGRLLERLRPGHPFLENDATICGAAIEGLKEMKILELKGNKLFYL